MSFTKYLLLWKNSLKLEISSEMAYKTSFFIRCIGVLLFGLMGPLIAILIYTTTTGIPGWTFWEFLFFQGTGVLVWGIGEFAMFSIVWRNMEMIRRGEYDRVLVRPYRPLLFSSFTAVDLDGIPQVILGTFLVIFSAFKIPGIGVIDVLAYIAVVLLALAFMYSFTVFVAALAFIVTKAFGLYALFITADEYTKYPLTVYGRTIGIVLTFVLPFGLASFYPAQAILGRLAWTTAGGLLLTVLGFFIFALLMWRFAMKKYSSAGG